MEIQIKDLTTNIKYSKSDLDSCLKKFCDKLLPDVTLSEFSVKMLGYNLAFKGVRYHTKWKEDISEPQGLIETVNFKDFDFSSSVILEIIKENVLSNLGLSSLISSEDCEISETEWLWENGAQGPDTILYFKLNIKRV